MIDIVIVNWNSGDYLRKCITSIITNSNTNCVNNIYVVDNNSSDNSLVQITANQKIHIISNKINMGFAKACNQGFKMCVSEFVLLLNPDTQLYENTLQSCIDFLGNNNDVDVLGCQLIDDKGKVSKSCARFPSASRLCFDSLGFSKIIPSKFHSAILMHDWDHKESKVVDQVMGAFMFMRLSIFKKVGYFDERFFVYFEELDFSYRLSKIGGKSFFNSDIQAIHSGGGTTESVKAYRLFLNLQSRLKYCKKHFSLPGYLSVLFCSTLVEPFTRIGMLMFLGRFTELSDVIVGYKYLYKSIFKSTTA